MSGLAAKLRLLASLSSRCFLILSCRHQIFASNQESGQIIERYNTKGSYLIVSLCFKMDFYFHVWTLCATGPFCLLWYQRELSARCPSVETEMTVRGYSLKIFRSDSLLLCICFCVSVTYLSFCCSSFLSQWLRNEIYLFTRLTHTGRFDHHLNNCHKLLVEGKGHSSWHSQFLCFCSFSRSLVS